MFLAQWLMLPMQRRLEVLLQLAPLQQMHNQTLQVLEHLQV